MRVTHLQGETGKKVKWGTKMEKKRKERKKKEKEKGH